MGATLLAGLAAALGWGALPLITWLGLGLFATCHFALLGRNPQATRQRWTLALAFGLIHGFGFAGVLGEMDLSTDRLAMALLGFNLGVEVGQLGVVLLAWPLLMALGRAGGGAPRRWTEELGSAAIAGLGTFWLVLRVAG